MKLPILNLPTHRHLFTVIRPRRFVCRLLTFVVLCFMPLPVTSAAMEAQSSEFQKLEQQFQEAKTKTQFAEVATAYESLKGPAAISASVLFNQANAWLKAEEYGRAIAGYRQALRLHPADPAIRSNLKLAVEKAGHTMSQPRALDYAFFWNQQLTGTTIAMLITLVIVVAAVLFVLNRRSSFSRTAFRILVALAVVFIASFVFKVNDEEFTQRGVVVVDSSDAKKGPAASYESAYSSALTDGREFTVIRQQQDWIEVDISGIGSGWLPESDVVLY